MGTAARAMDGRVGRREVRDTQYQSMHTSGQPSTPTCHPRSRGRAEYSLSRGAAPGDGSASGPRRRENDLAALGSDDPPEKGALHQSIK